MNECHCVAEIVQIYPNLTKQFFFLNNEFSPLDSK